MKPTILARNAYSGSLLLVIPALVLPFGILAQQPAPIPQTTNWTVEQDHQNMMEQLGIKALRPGPSGVDTAPNHANYDESKANPFPNLPAVLGLKNGGKVTSPGMWWAQRRPEIVEDRS